MKSKTPSYIVSRRIYTEQWQEDRLGHKYDLGNRFYNNGVRHYRTVMDELKQDLWYQANLKLWQDNRDDEDLSKQYAAEIFLCMQAYGLTEYDIHGYFGKGKQQSCPKGLGINIVQKLGTALYASIKKAVFAGTKIHFRKHGQTNCFEEKKSSSGIIYHPQKGTVSFMGMELRLKPVRATDLYMMEALQGKVKYCRIKREPFHNGYHYFLQIVMEGTAPEKIRIGNGAAGLDPGVSTMSYDSDTKADFTVLAPDIMKYQKAARQAAAVYERRRRMANPENYNPDGTVRRDTKTFHKRWKRTGGTRKALMGLKAAYRKQAVYVKNSHGYQTNRIVENCRTLIKEPMDYKALARRAKQLARQARASLVKKKDGTTRAVHKYKRRKRFGSSIGRRAPASFICMLERKMDRYGGQVFDVDILKYKASQYDHDADTYRKPELSDRTKVVGGKRVQRDLYSSFLLKHAKDTEHPDRESCMQDFKAFLKRQGFVVNKVIKNGDITGNFGLNDFVQPV